MTKTKRVLSAILAVIMVVSMLSSFGVSYAAKTELKGAASTNDLLYSPFKGLAASPGYGTSVPSTIMFVSSAWTGIAEGTTVYMEYYISGETNVYKAVYGTNAFSSIKETIDKMGRDNLVIKVGAGTYSDNITLQYNGIKFYGNYAGVNPNSAPTGDPSIQQIDKNGARVEALESVFNGSNWEFTAKSNNIHINGFKVTNMSSSASTFKIAFSGQTIENIYFEYNDVVNSGYLLDANRGTNNGVYIKNNRFTNCGGSSFIFMGGGGMSDVVIENNYYANCSAYLANFSSCGAFATEALISFSKNTVYNCSRGLRFGYDNANFGANLDYKRIEGNVFTSCGSAQSSIIYAQYYLEYMKNATDTAPTKCTDTGCKTYIANNVFYDIPKNVTAVNLTGGGNLSGSKANYVASVVNNKFMLENDDSSAIYSGIEGVVDCSYNFYGETGKKGVITLPDIKGVLSFEDETKYVSMPYYTDFDMTKLSGTVELVLYSKADLSAFKQDKFVVDDSRAQISCELADGYTADSVSFKNMFTTKNINDALDLDCTIYNDFLLTDEANDLTVEIADDITRGYVVAKHIPTGISVKYDLVVKTTTDKTKTDIRRVTYGVDNKVYDKMRIDGTVYTFNLDSSIVYFPFKLTVSPSASYKVYTDPDCKTLYTDTTGYIAPDKTLSLFVKVTGGDGNSSTVYTFNINRPGSVKYEARIFSVTLPESNVLLFNNESRTISYRPYALTESAKFDFVVSPNSSYAIYENYNASTGEVSGLLSSGSDIKDIKIGDAISYFYVKVTSKFGYSQVYKLVVYNDVRSTDNVITGITGMDNLVIDENQVIHIAASDTLSAVNAHFETDPFADVKVYPTPEKTYALTPASTYQYINNREVEVRTFQLGIENKVAYYYVDVTSEIGETNSYKIIITKSSAAVEFEDISGHWAENYIKQLSNLGITNGSLNGDTGKYKFSPDTNATRQEMAAFLLRMIGVDATGFKNVSVTDVFADADKIADWSYNYVKGVYTLGIMVGYKNAEDKVVFDPTAKITRQEFFQAITNLLKLDTAAAADCDLSKFSDVNQVATWAIPATKAVVKAGIIEGSGGKLNPKKNITRAEIAKIVVLTNTISGDLK